MSPETQMYLAQGIHGLAYGMLLFLVALGLTLIFGMMGVLDIAHASFSMLSAYLCVSVLNATDSYWLSMLVARSPGGGPLEHPGEALPAQACAGLGHGGHIAELLFTLGLLGGHRGGEIDLGGTEGLQVKVLAGLTGLVNIAGLEYPLYRLFIIGLSLAMFLLPSVMLFKTRLGTIVRVAISDPGMVSALGVNIQLVFMLVFGLGTWMAGVERAWPPPSS